MRRPTNGTPTRPAWIVQRGRWFLIAIHVPAIAIVPINVIVGLVGQRGNPAMAILAALAIGSLQLRHSFAAARGTRPRGWPWTGLALLVLVYLPMVWFTFGWAANQWFVVASALMLLRDRPGLITATLPILATSLTAAVVWGHEISAATGAFGFAYWLIGLGAGGVGLYGSARLVRVLDELHATRAELADIAVGRERLRISRDLHDLLGRSLSAVSLKGDLAIRLLRSDPSAARAEIQSLTEVARDALRSVRTVTRDEHPVSLRSEADGAAALLTAAGVDARVDLNVPVLQRPIEEVIAWAIREGITNVLRHSEATTCFIVARRVGRWVRLEITNDGAREVARGEGTGLAGLAQRASGVAGSVSTEQTRDRRFKLVVEIPEVPEEVA